MTKTRPTIVAAGGQDTLDGKEGNDTLNGGASVDTAIYSQNLASYLFSAAANVSSISGPDGSDTLSDIERLQFSDKTLAIDLGDRASCGIGNEIG